MSTFTEKYSQNWKNPIFSNYARRLSNEVLVSIDCKFGCVKNSLR